MSACDFFSYFKLYGVCNDYGYMCNDHYLAIAYHDGKKKETDMERESTLKNHLFHLIHKRSDVKWTLKY